MRWLVALLMAAYPTAALQGAPYGPLVSFLTQNILPPGAVYVSPNDVVELIARSPTVATNIQMTVRFLSPAGIVTSSLYTATIATAGTATQSVQMTPQEGFILSVQVVANNASRGQCFVKLQLHQNPAGGDPTLGALLLQGYVSADDHLSYPQSPTESSLNGRGWIHVVSLANPGAGSEWSVTVPAGVRWQVRAINATLQTSAAVANRTPCVRIVPLALGSGILTPVGTAQAASLVLLYSWWNGAYPLSTGTLQSAPLPTQLLLPAASVVTSFTNNLQVADAWTNISLDIEEWVGQ